MAGTRNRVSISCISCQNYWSSNSNKKCEGSKTSCPRYKPHRVLGTNNKSI